VQPLLVGRHQALERGAVASLGRGDLVRFGA
jgi:hypothetical protein